MIVQAQDVLPGDELKGWEGYVVTDYERHAFRDDGRIMLRDTRPITAPTCWTPRRPTENVEVTNR